MKNILLTLLFTVIWVSTVSASESKPYSLQFVELFTSEVLIDNYKKQLKNRIFQKKPQYLNQASEVDIWLNQVLASGQYEILLAQRYKSLFSESEFKDLVAFYKTATGKKFLTVAPKMSTMSATVAGQLVYKNLPELENYLKQKKQPK